MQLPQSNHFDQVKRIVFGYAQKLVVLRKTGKNHHVFELRSGKKPTYMHEQS